MQNILPHFIAFKELLVQMFPSNPLDIIYFIKCSIFCRNFYSYISKIRVMVTITNFRRFFNVCDDLVKILWVSKNGKLQVSHTGLECNRGKLYPS